MRNPFDRLSELSVDRPKTAISVAVIGILALSSFAQFIVFDNSEDAFYPENETTDLLYEVEGTYTVDIDLTVLRMMEREREIPFDELVARR